jgi:hypothetical protein
MLYCKNNKQILSVHLIVNIVNVKFIEKINICLLFIFIKNIINIYVGLL